MEQPQTYFKNKAYNRPTKVLLRNEVVELFSNIPGSPSVLTFPGEFWETEKAIIESRRVKNLDPCTFLCVEYDSTVYKKSVLNIPNSNIIKVLGSGQVKAGEIEFKHEEFSEVNYKGLSINCAWTDFYGQLTRKRIEALVHLWDLVTDYLIVTTMRGRYSTEIYNNIESNGSIGKYLQSLFQNSFILNEYDYGANKPACPMNETIFSRREI
jgi:hypothetical protein